MSASGASAVEHAIVTSRAHRGLELTLFGIGRNGRSGYSSGCLEVIPVLRR